MLREYCKSRNKMTKNQIFDLIVNKTASVCGVSAEAIKSGSRKADVVDARCMVFRFAVNEAGFTFRDIASLLGKGDPSAVRQLYHSYELRCRAFCFRELAAFLHAEMSREGVFSAE